MQDMGALTTGAQLQQLVCAMQWMQSTTHKFKTNIRPLPGLLEGVYIKA